MTRRSRFAVVGGGVVGCAVALGLARRGLEVTLFEAEEGVAFGASGTNSGILHTGFDSTPGELETELILRAVPLREEAIDALQIPVLRCGARMHNVPEAVKRNASEVGVSTRVDGSDLLIPGECVTDPVAFTKALRYSAEAFGADVRCGHRVTDTLSDYEVVINCAGIFADSVARIFGDDSFALRPRKGEFVVLDGIELEEILLPAPTKRTKGILVFPTIDGHVCCGPTAFDTEDKTDWTVREDALQGLLATASQVFPDRELNPVFMYAGLRSAGASGENYLIERSPYDKRLVNVAAIRSTGLTASLGIADFVCHDVLEIDRPALPLQNARSISGHWWTRAAKYRGLI